MSVTTIQLKKWTGDFGKKYTARNACSPAKLDNVYKDNYGITRTELNRLFLRGVDRSARILEVGCNVGDQLFCLQNMGFKNLYGVEPQEGAIEFARKRTPDINIIKGDAFDIPFRDRYFDVVYTSGVLIHISPKDIKKAIREIYRCSKEYIWGFEYYAKKYEEILYRGHRNLLWKTDFPKLICHTFPDLKVEKVKYLKYSGNDNVDVMYLLRKRHGQKR